MKIDAAPGIPAVAGVKTHSRIAGLDELRGLSIIWVMWCHGTVLWTWMPSSFSGYGFHGVVLFFIISGYLITRILLEEKDNVSYFSRFYVNRLFRIWPLMLAALAVSALIWPEHARMGVFNLLMVNNYAYAYGIEPMIRTDVMWSLAIEEQFYLVWPVIAFFMNRRTLAWTAAAIIFLGLSFDAGLIPSGRVAIIFKTTHGNMQYIAMGALVAIGGNGLRYLLGAWTAFMVFYLQKKGFVSGLADFRWVWYGVSFMLALLVTYTVHRRPLIRCSPLATVGKLCYGLYIIHFFISWAVLEYFGRGIVLHGTAYLVVSFVLALASYHYFEKPALDLRNYVHASEQLRILLFAALGMMVLTCAVALIPTMQAMR